MVYNRYGHTNRTVWSEVIKTGMLIHPWSDGLGYIWDLHFIIPVLVDALVLPARTQRYQSTNRYNGDHESNKIWSKFIDYQ